MATNPYFSYGKLNANPKSEQELYEDVIIEAIQMYGQDVYYIPRNIISVDDILNETIESRFDDAHLIEIFIESVDGWAGENDLLSKFGFEMRDEATVVVARKRFQEVVNGDASPIDETIHPNEGDLIYIPMTKALFVIKFIEDEQPFYQLENLPVFKMNIEKYEYRGEEIDTGIELLDDIQIDYSTSTTITNVTNVGSYAVGETVSISYTDGGDVLSTAEILKIVDDDIVLGQLSSTDGEVHLLTGTVWLDNGSSSNDGEVVSDLDDATNVVDTFNDNEDFESIGNTYIDFSTPNVFGDPDA